MSEETQIVPAALGTCWIPNNSAPGPDGPHIERVFALAVGERVLAMSCSGEWLPVGKARHEGRLRA